MTGRLERIAGPTVVASGLGGAAQGELVLVGAEHLLGEVIRIEGERATLQVYEETTGLALGEPAAPLGAPLTVELGPGLRGCIFDGIQRPLETLARRTGDFIGRGAREPALDRTRQWRFVPSVKVGDAIAPGQLLGAAVGDRAEGVQPGERVLVPPRVRGRIAEIVTGPVTIDAPILRLDDGRTLSLLERWPARVARPSLRRLPPDLPLLTGQRVLDCFFPVAAGGAAIVPGGFGTGKTILEQTLAKHAAVDVVVYVGCGERGNEMAELLDEFPRLENPRTGRPLLESSVLVVNTSNMPVAAREASVYTGITIAEYFRDRGLDVVLTIDSTSRWAEALREISSRLEEMPGEEGYPTYLATRVTQFYERSGRVLPLGADTGSPGGDKTGSVTVVGAVSPPGGDFSEPVTQSSLRAADALWALSPELAQRRHYPAIDWSTSFTLDAARFDRFFREAAGPRWPEMREQAMQLLAREHELAEIAQLVGIEALQDTERVILESARLVREGFLRQSAYHPVDATTSPRKMLWMLELLLDFHRAASRAVAEGVPLRGILAARLDDKLARLGETPPEAMATIGAEVHAAIDGALARLRAQVEA